MRQPPLSATILTFCGMAVLIGLGLWQIDRLHWKEALLAAIEQAYNTPPAMLDDTAFMAAPDDEIFLRRGQIRGQFMASAAFHIIPRTYQGQYGSHLIVPFRLSAPYRGGIVLVNAGWVPGAPGHDDSPVTDKTALPDGIVTLTGLLRMADRPHFFTPENEPARDRWYVIDHDRITARFDLDRIPADPVFYVEKPVSGAPYPVPHEGTWRPNNNHLSYAIFWLSMAFVLAVIFFLRFVMERKNL